jgi:hypothetical protein
LTTFIDHRHSLISNLKSFDLKLPDQDSAGVLDGTNDQ